MNNSIDEITVYKESNEQLQSPTFSRRALGYAYDFPEKTHKKEKKWSISNIFRRKKREDSDSSSEEDSQKKNFLGRRRKKPESKRKKPRPVGTFDHVVLQPGSRNSFAYNGCSQIDDNGVLSDPTGGFSTYIGRTMLQLPPSDSNQQLKESRDDMTNSKLSVTSGSVESGSTRKSRREQVKARIEAKRTSSKNAGSSSDDDSQASNLSLKIRSEENLRSRDGSLNRKSRAARTERYLKRRSRDGENPHNYLRLSKSDAENSTLNWKLSDDSNRSPSRSPIVSVQPNTKLSYASLNSQNALIGLSTIPPSHTNYGRFKVSNSTSNPTYKPPQSMNDYNNSTRKFPNDETDKYFAADQRSFSCDANIHKAPSTEFTSDILHVQFPISRPNRGQRNLSLIDASQLNKARQPPTPPPRDPNRLIGSHYMENGRPTTCYFDSNTQTRSKSFNSSNYQHPSLQQTRKFNSFNLQPNYRSTSEDHLPREPFNIHLATRPSSTTPDMTKSQKFAVSRDIRTNPEDFNYLTDKKPRSRKPIFIQGGKVTETKTDSSGKHKALDFWKQIDRQSANEEKSILKKTRSDSPQMFTSHTQMQTKLFIPSGGVEDDPNNMNNNGLLRDSSPSPFKPVTPTKIKPEKPLHNESDINSVSKEDIKRRSANLEEALNELEAIYNSLRLGDEDLLERAEQREKEAQAKKLLSTPYPNYNARGALSDSGFCYEPFDTVDSPKRKRILKKHRTADVKQDDMAFRKMNKERANTIADPLSAVSTISYLMTSPLHGVDTDHADLNHKSKEPDITYDDVVYRNVKHINNLLKVVEPQPPFGIPLGPIAPGANSDYLHATPEEELYRPKFKSRKIPNIVKDDLAFRNLRKDSNKAPALPPLSAEDLKNNNNAENGKFDLNYLKTKRSQRSLSANIGNMMHNPRRKNNNDVENEFKTLTDIADAMEIARKVLREKENKITATRKAFMSDTDTQYISRPSDTKETYRQFLDESKADKREPTKSNPSSPNLSVSHLAAKPPRGHTPERRRSTKESTPIPVSPLEKKSANSESNSSSLEDLLNALAEEAKETTERISNELKLLREDKQKRSNLLSSRQDDLSKRLSDIDAVSERAKLCEKLLDNVVDSNDLMSTNKLEVEEVKQIEEKEPATVEAANVVLSRIDSKEEEDKKVESDHDYENLSSDKELNIDEINVSGSAVDETKCSVTCKSPFEEHKAELIASFQELKDSMKDIEMPLQKQEIESKDGDYDNLRDLKDDDDDNKTDGVTGEEACDVLELALSVKECAFNNTNNIIIDEPMFEANCDIVLRKPNFILYDDSETSSGFHSNCSCGDSWHYLRSSAMLDQTNDNDDTGKNLESLESLKSPRLVMATNSTATLNNSQNDNRDYILRSSRLVLQAAEASSQNVTSSSSSNNDNNISRFRRCQSSNLNDMNDRHILDDGDEKPSPSWYRDPANVAIACSYGIACAHQLATIDLFAILGILFAVISFIAALFI